jgi:hypothetical protein
MFESFVKRRAVPNNCKAAIKILRPPDSTFRRNSSAYVGIAKGTPKRTMTRKVTRAQFLPADILLTRKRANPKKRATGIKATSMAGPENC